MGRGTAGSRPTHSRSSFASPRLHHHRMFSLLLPSSRVELFSCRLGIRAGSIPVCARDVSPVGTHGVRRSLGPAAHCAGNRRHAARSPDHDNFTAGSAVSRPERRTFQWRCMRGSRHLRSGFRKLLRPMILFPLLERLAASDIFLARPILHSGSRCMGSTRWRRRHICQGYEG